MSNELNPRMFPHSNLRATPDWERFPHGNRLQMLGILAILGKPAEMNGDVGGRLHRPMSPEMSLIRFTASINVRSNR
ncbi:MAG: hypothetical protein ACXVGO_14800 [Mycobacterium sp.]